MSAKQKTLIASPAVGLLIYQTDSTKGFYYYSGSAWVPVAGNSGAETDPQVGVNTTGKVPRWDGSALSTGAMYDNGDYIGVGLGTDSKYRVNSRTTGLNELEAVGKSALRGEANKWSGITNNIYATGFLGVKNPSGIYSIIGDGFTNSELSYLGAFGVKEFDTTQGAGVYGWTRGGASVNYGNMGVSTSNTGANYGIYGKAVGSAPANFGILGKAENANVNYGVSGSVNTNAGQFGYAIFGQATGSGTNHAGYFSGHVNISDDGEAFTIVGTNPFMQIKNSSTDVGYLQG
jgi:hypothetical protein